MIEFPTKTYRCEWVAEVYPIDQYGTRQKEPEFYLAAFPTREEALADLMAKTTEHHFLASRRIYNNAPHEYYSTGVRYREIEIASEGPKVAAQKSSVRDCKRPNSNLLPSDSISSAYQNILEALKNLVNLDQRSGWHSKEQDAAIATIARYDGRIVTHSSSQTLVALATAVLAHAPEEATEFMGISLDDIRSAISLHPT